MKTLPAMQSRGGYLQAASSGLLLTSAFPSPGYCLLAWIALVPLLVACEQRNRAQCFRLGMVAGLVHYLSLAYWLVDTMQTYGGLPLFASIPILFLIGSYGGLYFGCFAVAAGRFRPTSVSALIILPIFWVALEYLRSFLLTGIPWGLLGYSQYRFLTLIQIADIAGVYGISLILVLGNVAFWLTVSAWRSRQTGSRKFATALISLAATALVVTASLGYGRHRLAVIDAIDQRAPTIRVGVVQGDIDQAIKWDKTFIHQTVATYLSLTASLAGQQPELVVWPETATPFYFGRHPDLTPPILKAVRTSHSAFLIGSPSTHKTGGKPFYYNSAFLVDKEGVIRSRYDKTHLVPFGEYVPLGQWLPIEKFVAGIGDFSPGRQEEPLSWRPDVSLGVQICYEIIFPPLARALTQKGAGVLVNITNDAWYGRSTAPYQLFSMTVFRAIENRRCLVRAANTGISGFVQPSGRILSATSIFQESAAVQSLPVLTEMTLYSRWGDWLARACLTATAIIIFFFCFRNRRCITQDRRR